MGLVSCSNVAIAVGKTGSALRTNNADAQGATVWDVIVLGQVSLQEGLNGLYAITQHDYNFKAVS
jgi:hypothetical protein